MDKEFFLKQRKELTKNWMTSQRSIRIFINTVVYNKSDVEDLLQEVACLVAEKYDEYDSTRPFLPWAIGIAKIKIAEFYRRQKREMALKAGQFSDSLSEACIRSHQQSHPYLTGLEHCLKELDAKSRKLLMFRYSEDLSAVRIAEKLNTSPGSVRVMLNRIRNRLRHCIQLKLAGAKDSCDV